MGFINFRIFFFFSILKLRISLHLAFHLEKLLLEFCFHDYCRMDIG